MHTHIPYGYRIDNGKVVIDKHKAEIIKKIVTDYIAGKTANKIAIELSNQGVGNSYGKPSWNHGTIGKILENKKYLGNTYYPPLIKQKDFETVQQIREQTRIKLNRIKQKEKEKQLFYGIMLCGTCEEKYSRYKERRNRKDQREKWRCMHSVYQKDTTCREFTDDELKGILTKAMNRLIITGNLSYRKPKDKKIKGIECVQSDRKIEKGFEEGMASAALQELIYQRASERYQWLEVDDREYQTQRMQEILKGYGILPAFDEELFKKLVRQIKVKKDGILQIVFINGFIL